LSGNASIRAALIWAGLATAIVAPMVIAATSPLLAYRDAIYIASGFAGMVALALVLVQPLLASGLLPGLPSREGRRVHRWIGVALVAAVIAHVAGLWLTSAPDVIDALLLVSPTPFSVWGVAAMWATFAAAMLAALRGRLRIAPRLWRLGHTAFATVIVIGSVVHAVLIEGTMGQISKLVLCALVLAAMARALVHLRIWAVLTRR
jgi:predicted ferric reductase